MFVINILLVGGTDSFFLGSIIDKLLKEKCTLFHIAGKNAAKAAVKNKKVVTYNIDIDDEYVQFVVRSVMPDAIIYLGAFDDRHIWKDYHRASAKYMCELTNILVAASDLNVKKFIYLSTINVYGFQNEGIITEETPLAPSNVKSIIVAQGERLCRDFAEGNKIDAVCLRFGLIYGDLQFQSIQSDYIMKKCLDALVDRRLVINNQIFPAIFVGDAAIAVYKTIYLDGDYVAYNVCDDDTISDAEICDIILTEYSEYDIELEGDESYVPQDYTIDGSLFRNQFSFFQKTKYQEGIKLVAQYVRDNQYRLQKQKAQKPAVVDEKKDVFFYLKFLFRKLFPFFETLVVFLLFVGANYLLQTQFYITGIDMMILFVIVASITFGKQQAIISAFLALLYYIYENMAAGNALSDIMINGNFVIRIMFLFVVGVVIGHVRDRLHQKITDLNAYIEYLEGEYTKLDEINDVTVEVKQELEERLITYTDSLATNYAIIEEIDSLLPSKTYIKALGIICNILKTGSVSVYLRGDEKTEFNLGFWTSEKARRLGQSINLRYLPDIYESFIKDSTYANKKLDADLPLLAAPVRINDEIEAVVMVWELKFDSLTMYHINLFVTLMKILRTSSEKADYYYKSLISRFAVEYPALAEQGACLLSEREFADIVHAAGEGEKKYGIPFCLLSANLSGISVEEAFAMASPLLKGLYSMYIHDNRLEILINNMKREDVDEYLHSPKMLSNAQAKHIQLIELIEEPAAQSHLADRVNTL